MTSFDTWWREQTRKGDPQRNPRLVEQAFAAGAASKRPTNAQIIEAWEDVFGGDDIEVSDGEIIAFYRSAELLANGEVL